MARPADTNHRHPTQAGTYSFAVQLANVNYASGQICGPTGSQQLTITSGTGTSDRLLITSAGYNGHTNRLSVSGYDANAGALYALSVTATGKQLIAPESMAGAGAAGNVGLVTPTGFRYPCPTNAGCSLTVTDSLGSSATIHLGPVKY